MNRRRAIAIVACMLWLFAVEALPNLHLGTHDGAHSHAADGTIVPVGSHRHADGSVHAHAAPEQTKRRTHQLAFRGVEVAHAPNGLAHHAIALHQPAAPLLAPLPIDRPIVLVELAPRTILASIALLRPHARGPPA